MKTVRKMRFAGVDVDVLFVRHDKVRQIMERAKTNKRAALDLLSEQISAGKLIVGKGLHKTAGVFRPIMADASGTLLERMPSITVGEFQAEFEEKTSVFTAGGQSGMSSFFGRGETEEEAISKYLDGFLGASFAIFTTMKNKHGPLYVCGTNKKMRCFQLERS